MQGRRNPKNGSLCLEKAAEVEARMSFVASWKGEELQVDYLGDCFLFISCFSYLVMSLLGKDLTELRRRYTDRKMPHSISLKVGLQALQAIQDVHSIGFVHR